MKKLLTLLVAGSAILCAQAASVLWQSGVVFGPSDDKGTILQQSAYKLADTSTASMYLFLIDGADAYAKVQSTGVYKTYGADLTKATASSSTLTSSKFEDLTTSGHANSESVYAAILFTYTDSNNKKWYLENTATLTISAIGNDGSVSNLARYQGGVRDNGSLAAWGTEPVPEPTSGMLLCLGLAGLALRRRRA